MSELIVAPLTERQQALVEANVPLIYFVAGKYRQIPAAVFEDLIGKLFYRLCLSVARWDESRGHKISSYLVACLEGETKNFFRDQIWMVRPPRKLREMPFHDLIDSVGEDRCLAEREDEEREAIRTAAIPVPLDQLVDRPDREEPLSAALLADVDVEGDVVDRLGGAVIVREVFAGLAPEERYVLALQMEEREERAKLAELMDRFDLTRPQAKAVWAEVREAARGRYLAALEGVVLPESGGCRVLARILRARFVPPAHGFVQVRAGLLPLA